MSLSSPSPSLLLDPIIPLIPLYHHNILIVGAGGNAFNKEIKTPGWQKPLTSFFTVINLILAFFSLLLLISQNAQRDPNAPPPKQRTEEEEEEYQLMKAKLAGNFSPLVELDFELSHVSQEKAKARERSQSRRRMRRKRRRRTSLQRRRRPRKKRRRRRRRRERRGRTQMPQRDQWAPTSFS